MLLLHSLAVAAVVSAASAAYSPNLATPSPMLIVSSPRPAVTQAPSRKVVDLRLRAARRVVARSVAAPSILPCAKACLASAITKSTTCEVDDYVCECQGYTPQLIELGAYSCVAEACGYLVAENVFSAGSSVCASINGVAGFNGGGFGGVTSTQTVGRTKSVVVVTRTNGSGSVITSFVTGPTGGSNNNGGSGGSGSNTNNGGSGNNSGDQGSASKSSSGSGLSKGAIAGIAVGAAVGGILACVLAFFLWRSCQRKQNSQQGTVTDAAGAPQMVQQPQPPPAAAPFVGGKPELDAQGRPTTSVSPVSQPQVGTGGSTQHSVVSTPSPAQGAGYQPPLQPTHELHAGNQWPQGYYSGQQQQVYAAAPAAGYGVPGSGVTQPYGRGYAANSGPYEMPASPPPRP